MTTLQSIAESTLSIRLGRVETDLLKISRVLLDVIAAMIDVYEHVDLKETTNFIDNDTRYDHSTMLRYYYTIYYNNYAIRVFRYQRVPWHNRPVAKSLSRFLVDLDEYREEVFNSTSFNDILIVIHNKPRLKTEPVPIEVDNNAELDVTFI